MSSKLEPLVILHKRPRRAPGGENLEPRPGQRPRRIELWDEVGRIPSTCWSQSDNAIGETQCLAT
jgi:hypothetical protein